MARDHKYLRFSISDRIEHWLLTISFTTLAVTGLVQKFSDAGISEAIIAGLGGIETVRIIHRIAAVLMMLEVIYHIGVVGYRVFVRRSRLSMLPGMEDARNALHTLQYNLGMRQEPPRQGRFTFEEKAEYWALVWGTIIMVITGFMLWNPIATARILPGAVIPAAKAAHGAEAILATLAIIVWHFYGVHVKFFNRSMFTGHLAEEEMAHEHPLELARVKAGVSERVVPETTWRRRRRTFFAVYGFLAVIMLGAIYLFITFEETAIATVPPPQDDVVVFAPLTPTPFPTAPPTPTAAPTATAQPTPEGEAATPEAVAGVVWADVDGLLDTKCVSCHNQSTSLGEVNLETYQGALEVVAPGEPDDSLLVTLQEEGSHPGQFTDEELAVVREWIESGALEEGAMAPAEPEAPGEEVISWQEVSGLFEETCIACHNVETALGDVNLQTYATTLEVVAPGAPEESPLVAVQEEGGHPGQLTEEQLEIVRRWIADGAPEEASAPGEADTAPDAPEEPAQGAVEWAAVADLFAQKCTACHSEANALGDVNLSSYEAALQSVEPGEPGDSVLVNVQEAGGHPGQLTEEELELVRQWIVAGAPD